MPQVDLSDIADLPSYCPSCEDALDTLRFMPPTDTVAYDILASSIDATLLEHPNHG